MPTNEERKQVAARLRDARVKLESIPVPKSIGEQSFTYLLELTKAIGKHDGALFDRFADLIEPEPPRTCRVERMEIDEFGRYFYLSCGHMQTTHNNSALPYCPNCGCRIEED